MIRFSRNSRGGSYVASTANGSDVGYDAGGDAADADADVGSGGCEMGSQRPWGLSSDCSRSVMSVVAESPSSSIKEGDSEVYSMLVR